MTQVAVRAVRVVIRSLVIPIADHARGKNKQGDERQRYSEYANCLLHVVFGRSKPGEEPLEYYLDVGRT